MNEWTDRGCDPQDSARQFISDKWSFIRSTEPASQCEGLINYWLRCQEVFAGQEVDSHHSHIITVPIAMALLCRLPSGQGSLRRLRNEANEGITDRQRYLEAAKHLKSAARALGVREDLFLHAKLDPSKEQTLPGIELANHPSGGTAVRILTGTTVSSAPPLEGETPEELRERDTLSRVVQLYSSEEASFSYRQYLEYDRTRGGGGTNESTQRMAIRLLWEAWPLELQKTVGRRWRPNSAAANILTFCGHATAPNEVGKFVEEERRKNRS